VKNSMGMVKQFLMEYCEALYPNDVEAQDELFKKIVDGAETPSMEEMRYIVDDFRMKKLTPFSSFAAAEEARDEAIARHEHERRKCKKQCKREDLYNRLINYKFESALQYLPGSGLEECEVELVQYLAKQFGNCGCIEGDFSILINASLRSLPGFTDLHRRGHNGLG
jgi:hypothetical protein